MSMNDAYNLILQRLRSSGVMFDEMEHDPVYTMEDVEMRLKIPTKGRVKTLLVQRRSGAMIVCGISAKGKLNIRAVAQRLGETRSSLSLASAERVMESIGVPIGAIGLVLPEPGATVLVSESLQREELLYCGIGRNDKTLVVSPMELTKCEPIMWSSIEQ